MVIRNSEFRIPNSCAEVCYNTPMKTPTSRTCRLSIVVTLLISLTAITGLMVIAAVTVFRSKTDREKKSRS